METRTNWVSIAVAIGFAVIVIGAAVATAEWQKNTPASTNIVVEQGTETATVQDEAWRTALDSIATKKATNAADYRAPAELGTTDSLSQELVATYFKQKGEGTLGSAEGNEELKAVIARNINALVNTETYTLASIKTNQSVTYVDYAEQLGDVMQISGAVSEYELTTFARTLHAKNKNGTSELAAAAGIYRTIETQLVAMTVPPQLAADHLGLVKSIAHLAQAVELMATWNGDPVDSLAFIEAFIKADRETKTSFDALFATMVRTGKSS